MLKSLRGHRCSQTGRSSRHFSVGGPHFGGSRAAALVRLRLARKRVMLLVEMLLWVVLRFCSEIFRRGSPPDLVCQVATPFELTVRRNHESVEALCLIGHLMSFRAIPTTRPRQRDVLGEISLMVKTEIKADATEFNFCGPNAGRFVVSLSLAAPKGGETGKRAG